jgi:hypothetical protein
MILDSLARHEHKFTAYECTEQCNGICMNGFISGHSIVLRYIRKINELFQDEEYLREQQKEFEEEYENWAFTEMRAYKKFKEDNVKSIKLSSIIDGSTFDDCICQENNMKMERLPFGRWIKRVYLSPDGRFYCFDMNRQVFVRMNSLNLSWVPFDLFKLVSAQVKRRAGHGASADSPTSSMPTLCQVYRKRYFLKIPLMKVTGVLRGVVEESRRFARNR